MKILIAVPYHRYWEPLFGLSMVAMYGYTARKLSAAEIHFAQVSATITKARNDLAKAALAAGADYAFFVDTDMTFPPTTLMELLAHEKDIVAATYAKRTPPHEILGHLIDQQVDLSTGPLQPAAFMPGGCMLIHTKVFKAMEWPYFFETYDEPNDEKFMSEDYNFCRKARQHGFEIWCDFALSERLGHLGSQVVTIPEILPKALSDAA